MSSKENDDEVLGFYFLAEKWEGTPYNKAANKHERIEWVDLKNLPSDLIPRNRQALEKMQQGIAYSEHGWN